VTNPEFIERIANFFQVCVSLMEEKNPDYAHQGVPLYDMFHTAYQEMVAPETVLRILLTKHWSAISAWSAGKELKSETLESRLQDACNYIGMLAMLSQEEGPHLVKAIHNYAKAHDPGFSQWIWSFGLYSYGHRFTSLV
jgi:hypothetical protein